MEVRQSVFRLQRAGTTAIGVLTYPDTMSRGEAISLAWGKDTKGVEISWSDWFNGPLASMPMKTLWVFNLFAHGLDL